MKVRVFLGFACLVNVKTAPTISPQPEGCDYSVCRNGVDNPYLWDLYCGACNNDITCVTTPVLTLPSNPAPTHPPCYIISTPKTPSRKPTTSKKPSTSKGPTTVASTTDGSSAAVSTTEASTLMPTVSNTTTTTTIIPGNGKTEATTTPTTEPTTETTAPTTEPTNDRTATTTEPTTDTTAPTTEPTTGTTTPTTEPTTDTTAPTNGAAADTINPITAPTVATTVTMRSTSKPTEPPEEVDGGVLFEGDMVTTKKDQDLFLTNNGVESDRAAGIMKRDKQKWPSTKTQKRDMNFFPGTDGVHVARPQRVVKRFKQKKRTEIPYVMHDSLTFNSDSICPFQSGDGISGGTDKMGGNFKTGECVDKCIEKRKTENSINGVTVDAKGVCYCERGMIDRDSKSKGKSCFLGATASNSNSICMFESGDGGDGSGDKSSENRIGDFKGSECVDACITKRRADNAINGVTVYADTAKGGCYCEKGMTKRNGVTKWQSCFLLTTENQGRGSKGATERNIRHAIEQWQTKTCLEFREFTRISANMDFIEFFDGGKKKCYSHVGRVGGKQNISMSGECGLDGRTALHVIGHALGLYHEQSRPDRDEHVEIVWDHVQEQYIPNFSKYYRFTKDEIKDPYDFESVMHYKSDEFGKGHEATIKSKPLGLKISGDTISDEDARRINRLYCD